MRIWPRRGNKTNEWISACFSLKVPNIFSDNHRVILSVPTFKKHRPIIFSDSEWSYGRVCTRSNRCHKAFQRDLSLFLEKSSKYFQRSEHHGVNTSMVLSSLPKTEEAKAFVWNVENLEVRSRIFTVQVVVVFTTINFSPRVFGPGIWDFDYPTLEVQMTRAIRPHWVTRWNHSQIFEIVTDPRVRQVKTWKVIRLRFQIYHVARETLMDVALNTASCDINDSLVMDISTEFTR